MFVVSFNNTDGNRVDISQIQVQPFGDWKDVNGTFSAAQECPSDNGDDGWTTRKIVALALVILIGLVIVVGLAVCINKMVKNKRKYQAVI